MNKDALLINKLAAAVLVAGLLAMVVGELSGILYSVDNPETVADQSYVIADPASDTQSAAAPVDAAPAGPGDILGMLATADIDKGIKVAKKCGSCHSFDDGGAHKVGPNLYNLVNDGIGGRDYAYSDAMAAFGGEWDYNALNEFLYNPTEYVPGTKMSFKGLKKDADRANLIAYLRSLSASPVPLP